MVGKSGTEYRFDCPVCEGVGEVATEDEDDESALTAEALPPVALAPLVCSRCSGAGQLMSVMMVAGGCAPRS